MRLSRQILCAKTGTLFWVFTLFASYANVSYALDISQASEQVKSLICKDNLTVSQALDKSIKSHSQRDIGWRAFQEADYFDIERAVLINKAMELRYRWRVSADGNIAPQTDRAEKLCSAESE